MHICSNCLYYMFFRQKLFWYNRLDGLSVLFNSIAVTYDERGYKLPIKLH